MLSLGLRFGWQRDFVLEVDVDISDLLLLLVVTGCFCKAAIHPLPVKHTLVNESTSSTAICLSYSARHSFPSHKFSLLPPTICSPTSLTLPSCSPLPPQRQLVCQIWQLVKTMVSLASTHPLSQHPDIN